MADEKSPVLFQAVTSLMSSVDLANNDMTENANAEEKALNRLRELVLGEPLLHIRSDDDFLLMFLRSRKFDADRAFKNITSYLKARRDFPEIFDDLSPSRIPFESACRKHRIVTVSRHRDYKGRPTLMLKIGAWSTDVCSLNDLFRFLVVFGIHLLLQEECQVKGLVGVVDCTGLGAYHLAHYTPSAIRKFIRLVQDCFPLRIKAVYVINHPAIFELLYAISRRFLKAKLVQRIRLFGYNVDKLHDLVPADLISVEHGGTYESYDYDATERELMNEEDSFVEFSSFGYLDKATGKKC
ncbi:alpha-tocopherol transfer protein-like [Dermacentor andersoni]|uniref:alpha-tocopherol transfer protein-like n=1 Tax=Dermacentor andersoni TaxID=34620 RepID=UPI003B3A8941